MNAVTPESRHLSTYVDRPLAEVYEYASNPAHLPDWAPGLGSSIEKIDGEWVMESPMGRIVVTCAPPNGYGVLDHYVTVASGERFYNPMRVVANGTGCEIIFTLRRQPEMTDEEFERDAKAVLGDLMNLKEKAEAA
jgi:hypothetical protein